MTARRLTTIWFSGKRIDVPAWPTPVPGLVIIRITAPAASWNVSHESSGAAVLKLPEPEAALHAAIRLAGITDWLLPGTVLRRRPAVGRKVRALARELACYELTYGNGGTVSDEHLALTEAGGA